MEHLKVNYYRNKIEKGKTKVKQEAHGPRFAHLSKTAIAYLQMPCNILPVLP